MYHRDMDGVSAFVLAGGKSTRMGTDKALIEFDGSTLLARALRVATAVAPEVRIVGPREKFAEFGQVVEDEFPHRGPLGGIQAALRASTTDLNFVLAVDLPFIQVRFAEYLLLQAQNGKAVVTAPCAGGGWQPLCAVYRKQFAEVAERALRQGRNKIDPLFAEVDVRVVEENELTNAAFSPSMFRNLNTPEDLNDARKAEGSVR